MIVNVECKDFIGTSRTEELVENFMARLAAWIITRTGALNATVTQKQYIVGVDSTALLATCVPLARSPR